jgi:hypothetical protein
MKAKNIICPFFPLILLFCTIFLVNCADRNLTESIDNKYQGSWLWIKSVGGLGPRVTEPKEGMTLKKCYDDQGIFRIFRNDSLKVTGSYLISGVENGRDEITYSNVTADNYYFNSHTDYARIHTDTLELWDGNDDGYFSFYKKIK